jgi:hypothetical protein
VELQARLDVLEGRVEEQSRHWERLFAEIGRLDQKLDQKIDLRADSLSARIDALRLELETKIDMKTATLEHKLESTIKALSDKIDRHFMWLVGIQIAALVAIIGALIRR